MLSGMAMSMMALVVWISACGGVGSPEGWLRINILEGRISFRSKLLVISYVRKGHVIGVSSSLQIVIDPKCHAVAGYETPRSHCSTESESISILPRAFHSALTAGSGTCYSVAFSNGSDREGRQTTRFLLTLGAAASDAMDEH